MKNLILSVAAGLLTVATLPQLTWSQQNPARYPTATEIERVRSELPRRIREILSGDFSYYLDDRRTPAQKQEYQRFRNGWSNVNPSIAPFLGSWSGYEQAVNVYPSTTPRRVCIIEFSEMGFWRFTTGMVNGEIIRANDRRLLIRSGNYLSSASVYGNQVITSDIPLHSPRVPESPSRNNLTTLEGEDQAFRNLVSRTLQGFREAGCTAALPDRIYSRCLSSNNYCYQMDDRGPAIRQIIGLLIDKGYYQGNNDGIFGPRTQAAIESLQQDNNLKPDGIAGPSTINALCRPANADEPNLSAQERNRIEAAHRNCQETLLNNPENLN